MCNGIQRCERFNTGEEKMETQEEGVEKLFFELASESRLGILRKLLEKDWKMNEVARKLALTTTETFRQLQRLSEGLLVQKQPEGTYAITEYGRVVLQLSAPLEFVFKHKQYFVNHDFSWLPPQFMSRIGELSRANLMMGMVESTMKSSRLIGEAEKFMWAVSPEPVPQAFDDISKQIPKGAEYRILSPQPPVKLSNLENRTLSEPPAIMAVTEKEGVICFRFTEGRVDYAGFFGRDPEFLSYVKDLFLYCWNKGKRF
jgi:predicted transcriptional regulator